MSMMGNFFGVEIELDLQKASASPEARRSGPAR